MVMAAVVLVLRWCLVTVSVGLLHPIIVVMVMLIDGNRIADVADLMSIPSGRRRGHAKRDDRESKDVPIESKSGHHGDGS